MIVYIVIPRYGACTCEVLHYILPSVHVNIYRLQAFMEVQIMRWALKEWFVVCLFFGLFNSNSVILSPWMNDDEEIIEARETPDLGFNQT